MYLNIIGTDGSGKNVQMEKIIGMFPNALVTREPGGSTEAEIIRNILLDNALNDAERLKTLSSLIDSDVINQDTRIALTKAHDIISRNGICGEAEAFLYAASRSESLEKTVRPFLKKGMPVLGNRSVACSVAYQGHARELGMEYVWSINEPIVNHTYPNIEIYLDLPIPVAMERLAGRTEKQDRLDGENQEFFEKVRTGYLHYYENICPYPYAIIDADGSVEEVHKRILKVINETKTKMEKYKQKRALPL